jgi:hypothetical protein
MKGHTISRRLTWFAHCLGTDEVIFTALGPLMAVNATKLSANLNRFTRLGISKTLAMT